MRILSFCDYYGVDPETGGAEIVQRHLAAHLGREPDVELTIVGGDPGLREPGTFSDESEVRRVAIPGRDLTRVVGSQLMCVPGLRRAALAEVRGHRPDLIHVNGLHFHSSVVGARMAHRLGIPMVATAHLADLEALRGTTRLLAEGFDRSIAARIARSADRVVAVSQAVADRMLELGVSPLSVRVVKNGVDHVRFAPVAGSRPARKSLELLLVGRLVHNKGTLEALEAVASVRRTDRDVRLTVVGDGPLEARARRRCSDDDLAGAVRFTGRVADVERWLGDADALLRPSLTEGLPLAVLEALACGTPVICSALPGSLELVNDGRNGLVVRIGDVPDLAAAIQRLHDDRELLARLGAAAPESVSTLTWERSAQGHREVFTEVLGG